MIWTVKKSVQEYYKTVRYSLVYVYVLSFPQKQQKFGVEQNGLKRSALVAPWHYLRVFNLTRTVIA